MKSLLGAPSNTKVLLCVDGLSKCIDPDSQHFSTHVALKTLLLRLDSDETFYLAVSLLGVQDLSQFSNHLMVQTLGPLWYTDDFNPAMSHLLPEALRPFYHEDTRQWLPFRKSDMELYDELSWLLTTAAGHPKRLEVLFSDLGKFKASQSAVAVLGVSGSDAERSPSERRAAGRLFVDELTKWLHHTDDDNTFLLTKLARISAEMESIGHLPTDYSKLLPMPPEQRRGLTTEEEAKHMGYAIEELATFCAKPFDMPQTEWEMRDWMATVLCGVSQGFCQLVSIGHI